MIMLRQHLLLLLESLLLLLLPSAAPPAQPSLQALAASWASAPSPSPAVPPLSLHHPIGLELIPSIHFGLPGLLAWLVLWIVFDLETDRSSW